jgi:hypothetical protein
MVNCPLLVLVAMSDLGFVLLVVDLELLFVVLISILEVLEA